MVQQVVIGTLLGMGCDVINIGLATTPTTEMAVLGPVSYTHLDVYKRQPCHTDMNPILLKPTADQTTQVILNGKAVGNQSARSYFNVEQRKPLFVAVSYTHLDVYKRQL